MRSSSADRGPGPAGEAPLLGRWARLVLGTLLVVGVLLGPAVGFASAEFGAESTVTITITITPTDGAAPAPEPTATLDEPAPLP